MSVTFTPNHEQIHGPLYQCPAVATCGMVVRSKTDKPKCFVCGRIMELYRPETVRENAMKLAKQVKYVMALCAALWAADAQAGCRGHQASAGCQGHQAKATGCVGAQAGCQSQQASCYGGSGFQPVRRLFDRVRFGRTVYSAPSAAIPPAQIPAPMPSKADVKTTLAKANSEIREFPNYAQHITTQGDALDAANAQRAKRGLRPFQRDDGLMAGALACAQYRAARRLAGHAPNDFAFLPAGANAKAAGCSGLEPSWGFQSCCLYENWTYAGAASVPGSDGRIYHQLFVR